jgi:putative glutamine amidotransferase
MMRVAVTDTMGGEHKFQQYISWLELGKVDCRRLSYLNGDAHQLDGCDGLLLTGGHDVDPLLYSARVDPEILGAVDRRRDDFELQVLERAFALGLPLLGICRGLQIANVHFGGSLIPDLERAGYRSHRSSSDGAETRHSVEAVNGSLLHSCTREIAGTVNSSHHQAADRLGAGLRVTARSDDGVIEAIERTIPGPFFLLIQWHPERMADHEGAYATAIRQQFVSSLNQNARGVHLAQKER